MTLEALASAGRLDRVDVIDPQRHPRSMLAASSLAVQAEEDLLSPEATAPKVGSSAPGGHQSHPLAHPSLANHSKLARRSETFRIGVTTWTSTVGAYAFPQAASAAGGTALKNPVAPTDADSMGKYEAPSYGDGTSPISGANVAHFRLGRIPVRIEFPFFLVAVLLGLNTHKDVLLLLAWVVVVLVSILVHELGHALVGRAFGEQVSIVLHGMGGLTFRTGRYASANEDIVVSLAGSLTQIVFLGLPAMFLVRSEVISSFTWYVFFSDLAWVSLGWGIINLLPILPLDGGNITITVLRRMNGIDADRIARLLSVGAALGLAIWAYHSLGFLAALWALFFAVWNAAALTRSEG